MITVGTDLKHSIVRTCFMVEVVSRLVGQLHDFLFFLNNINLCSIAAIGTDKVTKISELQCYSVIHY